MALLQKLITILDMLEKNIENLNAHKKYITSKEVVTCHLTDQLERRERL
jgi:hypothetical protein